MKKWIPQRLMTDAQEAIQRSEIVARACDLVGSDPQAAGIVTTFGATVVGAGLIPFLNFDYKLIGLTRDQFRLLQRQQYRVFRKWVRHADAGRRMTFFQLQWLAMRNLVQYGEYLFLVRMLDDPGRPYSLALKPVNPQRLATPTDLSRDERIRDGVQIGKDGEPVAYWIKKAGAKTYSNHSKDFVRVPLRAGHRVNVLHGFFSEDAEQVRGYPWFTPAMKFFRDLSDFLDAELVSNIVTAAFALFIEVGEGGNPWGYANRMATIREPAYKSDGSAYDQRYEELVPGRIMYGNRPGEKPHPIKADRPGTTFDPFVTRIETAISNGFGVPHPVLFRQFKGMNYASYRSAMLEAWRIFSTYRSWLGWMLCQPPYTMLCEEGWLRGDIDAVPAEIFYENMEELTAADWIGPPKGQIEPVKETQGDLLQIKNKLKSRTEHALERQRDIYRVFDQLEEENEEMDARGLDPSVDETVTKPETGSEDEAGETEGEEDGS